MNLFGLNSVLFTNSLRGRLLRGAAGTLWVTVSYKLLMFVSSVILARLLGVSDYGMYVTVMAILMILCVPAQLGMPNLSIRLMADYGQHKKWGLMRGLLSFSTRAVIVSSIFISLVVLWVLPYYEVGVKYEATLILWIGLFILPLMALIVVYGAFLRGLHYIVLSQIPEKIVLPSLFVGLLLGLWLLFEKSSDITTELALGMRLIAAVVAFTVTLVLLYLRIPKKIKQVSPVYDVKGWGRPALPLLFVGILTILNTQIDVIMLSHFRGVESAGIYQAAARVSDLVSFFLVVINLSIQSTLSQFYAIKDMVSFQRLVTMSSRAALIFAVFMALLMVFLAKPIMGIVFGVEFILGASVVLILVFAQVVNAGMGSVGIILNMTGHEKYVAYGLAAGVSVNVLLCFLLVPEWGREGAAIANALSIVFWNVLLSISVYRKLNIWSPGIGRLLMTSK